MLAWIPRCNGEWKLNIVCTLWFRIPGTRKQWFFYYYTWTNPYLLSFYRSCSNTWTIESETPALFSIVNILLNLFAVAIAYWFNIVIYWTILAVPKLKKKCNQLKINHNIVMISKKIEQQKKIEKGETDLFHNISEFISFVRAFITYVTNS